MGVVLLMVGVRQSYAKSTAESELIKQYEFMYRIFHNARRRIDAADSDADKRRVLKVLGDSALEEHAEWILIHRERSIDEREGAQAGLTMDEQFKYRAFISYSHADEDWAKWLHKVARDLSRAEASRRPGHCSSAPCPSASRRFSAIGTNSRLRPASARC